MKAVCQRCKRTIEVVLIEGVMTRLDNEILPVVQVGGTPRRLEARQLHDNVCIRYVSELERAKADIARRRELKAEPPPDTARRPAPTRVPGPGVSPKHARRR